MPYFTTPSSAGSHRYRRLDFAAINAAALARLPELLAHLLPGGRRIGREWVCGNLRGEPGRSYRVNLATGRWADFATGERGGDPVSLYAAILRVPQAEAARRLAELLGVEGGRHA
jgi:putative DNA primase/helicase